MRFYCLGFKMWPLAILTDDCINKIFLLRKCMAVLPGQKKTGRNNKVTVLSRWP